MNDHALKYVNHDKIKKKNLVLKELFLKVLKKNIFLLIAKLINILTKSQVQTVLKFI